MKYSAWPSASTMGYPFTDAKPIVRRSFDAFGADRMIWGGLGAHMEAFNRNSAVLDDMFDFATDEDRAKVRGLTAMQLFDL
jgi:predicted TIM-barrel fold metal-dependent hydrolase